MNRFLNADSHETRSLVNYRYSSHFLRSIRTRRVLVLTRALTAATSFRSKLLPILLRHLVTNLLGPRLVAKAVSTIRVRLHVNPDVNRRVMPSYCLGNPTASPPFHPSIAIRSTFLEPRCRLSGSNNGD